jgi:predicted GIY-YIG superfamily endonuclease
MVYVYILRSLEHADRYYVGITADLRSRLKKHNAGEVSHTSKFAPWAIKTYVAFSDERQAFSFEKYLKSPSGRAFAKSDSESLLSCQGCVLRHNPARRLLA